MKLKRTSLYNQHLKLKAKMVPFSGWEMPVQYTNVIDEHNTTRTKVGLFDISHMGEIYVCGVEALNLIQRIVTNNMSNLEEGKCKYTTMCHENGNCIDDCFVYFIKKEKYLLVVNASNIEKDYKWIMKHANSFNVIVENASERIGKIDVQGPLSEKVLQKLSKEKISIMKRFGVLDINLGGVKTLVSRSGYTGEDGFELYFDVKESEKLWKGILKAGKSFGIKPCGLGARDTLRVEACYSLYGHELSESINPVEAGLGFLVSTKKENYIGRKFLVSNKEKGAKRTIVTFEMVDRGIARNLYKVFVGGLKVGYVTSGTYAPFLKKNIGMALVDSKYSKIGRMIDIEIRGKKLKAKIVKRPFYGFKGGK